LFITRLPATYSECGRLIAEAVAHNTWEEVGVLAHTKPTTHRPVTSYNGCSPALTTGEVRSLWGLEELRGRGMESLLFVSSSGKAVKDGLPASFLGISRRRLALAPRVQDSVVSSCANRTARGARSQIVPSPTSRPVHPRQSR